MYALIASAIFATAPIDTPPLAQQRLVTKPSLKHRYLQLLLLIVGSGVIYPAVYMRQNFEDRCRDLRYHLRATG